MKLLTRRPAAPDETTDSTAEDALTTRAPVEWTGPAAWVTKTITGGLLACLVAGPMGLLLAGWLLFAAATTPVAAPVVAGESRLVDERTAVEAFASDFVVTWLTTTTGQEERLAPFLASYSGLTMPEEPWLVRDAAPAGIVASESAPGSWSVTVAATVAESDKVPANRRHFQVPVVYADGALVAQSLPAPVSAPGQATSPKLDYRYRAALSDPVATAAGEFLTALLVGGDVTRFISPTADIRAVSPAPYATVEVDDVQVDEDLTDLSDDTPTDGQQLHLLVTAVVTPGAKAKTNALTVQYALTVTARAGRWEISSLDPSPMVTRDGTSPTTTDQAPSVPDSTSPGAQSPDPDQGSPTESPTQPTPAESPTN